jgi:hypothetical protein
MQFAFLASPNGGPQVDEPYDPPEPEPLPDGPPGVVLGSRPLHEPAMRAVNGYLVVSYLGGPPRYHYVARDPDFIAEQLRTAIKADRSLYRYWSRPGERDPGPVWIPCRLVTNVQVQHLEPDLDALYDDSYELWCL